MLFSTPVSFYKFMSSVLNSQQSFSALLLSKFPREHLCFRLCISKQISWHFQNGNLVFLYIAQFVFSYQCLHIPSIFISSMDFKSVLLTPLSRSCINILNKDGCVTDSWSFPSHASNKLRHCSLSLRNNSHFITRMWQYFCPKYIYAKAYLMVIYAILYKVIYQGVFIVLMTFFLSPKFWQIF